MRRSHYAAQSPGAPLQRSFWQRACWSGRRLFQADMTFRPIHILSIALFLSGICGCRGTTTTEPSATPTSATYFGVVMPGALTLAVGDTTQIRSVAALRNDTYQVITTLGSWVSSDPAVVTVNESGVARGVAPGTADVTLTLDGLTAKATVTVTPPGATSAAFWGGAALPGGDTATLMLSTEGVPRVSGTLFFARGAVTLTGLLDAPTNILSLVGGGYSFTGTLVGAIASGTFTDASGAVGGFVAVDAGHAAVASLCGKYTSNGVTVLDSADEGGFVVATSLEGTTAATAVTADATTAPLIATGRRQGDKATLVTSDNRVVDVALAGGTVTGVFTTATGAAAAFNATTAGCH
jgi:hypothetical protein